MTGLSGPATAAHFHSAESGKNGAVVVPIAGADKGSFEGSATLTDAQAEELMAGKWYVNIHTAANKAGEVRGQVHEVTASKSVANSDPPAPRRRVLFSCPACFASGQFRFYGRPLFVLVIEVTPWRVRTVAPPPFSFPAAASAA